MGRPKKRQIKGHRTKAEKAARLVEPVVIPSSCGITPPKWLSEAAKEEFMRVVSICDSLTELDVPVLAVYADAVINYERLTSVISEVGPVIVKRRVTGKVDISPNPAVSAQAEMVHRIMQCSLKLGLAVTDRLRLAAPPKEDEHDEFSEFEG